MTAPRMNKGKRDWWAEEAVPGLLAAQTYMQGRAQDAWKIPAENVATGLLAYLGDPQARQQAMDMAALSPGLIGDVVGPVADTHRFYNFPETRTAGEAGLAAMGALPFVPHLGGGFMGTIAGKNAKLADQAMLKLAKESEGKLPPEKIFDATGWWKGKDGKWRWEIDDSQMRFKDVTNPDEFPFTNNPYYNADYKVWETEFPEMVADFVEHDKLFDNYPSLNRTRIQKEDGDRLGWGGASYLPNYNAVLMGKMGGLDREFTPPHLKMTAAEEARDVLSHEMNHAVQYPEAFAKGGNMATAGKLAASKVLRQRDKVAGESARWNKAWKELSPYYTAKHISDLDKLANKSNIRPREIYSRSDWYEVSDQIGGLLGRQPTRKSPARDEWFRAVAATMRDSYIAKEANSGEALKLLRESGERGVKNGIRRLERRLDKHREGARKWSDLTREANDILDLPPDEAYMRLVGEVEARNVQKRLDFSPDYRRMLAPWKTEDRKATDQLLGASALHRALPSLMKKRDTRR